MQRPQEQALDQGARDQTGKIWANKVLTLVASSNAGVAKSRKHFLYQCLIEVVRSEGGRICCDFNHLRRWVRSLGALQTQKYLSEGPLKETIPTFEAGVNVTKSLNVHIGGGYMRNLLDAAQKRDVTNVPSLAAGATLRL